MNATWGETAAADDAELLRLAQPPPPPILSVLDRAGEMRPLVWVVALLACVYAVSNRTLNEFSASWVLRSANVVAAESWPEFLDPPAPDAAAGRAPLLSWLQAIPLALGPTVRVNPVVVSAVAGLVAVIVLARLTARFLDARRSLVACVLAISCGPFLVGLGSSTPAMLGTCLSLLAVWVFLLSTEAGARTVSWSNAGAGVALGACVLASGPHAVVVGAAMVLWAATDPPGAEPTRGRTRVRRLQSAGFVLLVGLVVGGWWPAMQFWQTGSLLGWLDLPRLPDAAHPAESVRRVVRGTLHDTQLLAGLFLWGLWTTCRDTWRSDDRRPGLLQRFALVWLGVGLAARLVAVSSPAPEMTQQNGWRFVLLVPELLLVTVGVDAVVRRRIGLFTLCVLLIGGFAVWLHFGPQAWSWPAVLSLGMGLLVLLAGLIGILLSVGRIVGTNQVQTAVVTVLLVSTLLGNAVAGWNTGDRSTGDDEAVWSLRSALAGQVDVVNRIVILEEEPPTVLVAAVRSLWPRASFQISSEWNASLLRPDDHDPSTVPLLVVEHGPGTSRRLDVARGRFEVDTVAVPRLFSGAQLRAYIVRGASMGKGTDVPAGPDSP